jgi:muramidase (phage lysozyme)
MDYTWKDVISKSSLFKEERKNKIEPDFCPLTQDRVALALISRRKILKDAETDEKEGGEEKPEKVKKTTALQDIKKISGNDEHFSDAVMKLAYEWASFPGTPDGFGVYDGQTKCPHTFKEMFNFWNARLNEYKCQIE